MSRAWTWRNAILKSKLSATTKHVLMVISCHMNDMGDGCYPSTKRIAELASLSERSVCTHIDNAERAGWLSVSRHGFDGQKWARHEYKPLWPKGTESASSPDDKGTEPHAEGTEPHAQKALNDVQSNISDKHSSEVSQLGTPEKKKAKKNENRGQRLESYLEQHGQADVFHDWGVWCGDNVFWEVPRIEAVFDTFRDYWRSQPGAKGSKSDWDATWRNWCRREHERTSRSYGGSAVRSASQRNAVGALFEAAGWDEAARKRS